MSAIQHLDIILLCLLHHVITFQHHDVTLRPLQCFQAITNVALTTLDARENTPRRVRAREYLNHFTMALALFTVFFDAIRSGFGLDVKPTMKTVEAP